VADEVIVETNWILDVAFHQDDSSETLLDYALNGHVPILLPSFCIAEAVKAVETKQSGLDSVARNIANVRNDIVRSKTLAPIAAESLERAEFAVAQISDVAEAEFWQVLEKIVGVAQQVVPTVEAIHLTAQFGDMFNLSPADSAVLAAVTEARRAGRCTKFMTRDGAFRAAGPLGWLTGEGIEYFLLRLRSWGQSLSG
jgi:predicted nucleic acid-binding protein